MPFAEATERSCVLRADGWAWLGPHVPDSAIIWGVNRHGQWETARVHFSRGESVPVYYLGTSLTFGAFSQQSKIVTRDGRLVSLLELSKTDVLANCWTELPAVELETDYGFDPSCYIIAALESAAAFIDARTLAIRSRSKHRKSVSDALRSTFTKKRSGESYFFLFDKTQLRDALATDWCAIFEDLMTLLFGDTDQTLIFDRTETLLLCYRIAHAIIKRKRIELTYDNQQATRLIKCASQPASDIIRMSPCRCAFVASDQAHAISLEWEDRSWNPVLNHLILG